MEMKGNDHSQQQGNLRRSRCSKCASHQLGERVRLDKVTGKSMKFSREHNVSGSNVLGSSS